MSGRFRRVDRAMLSDAELVIMDQIKGRAEEVEVWIEEIPDGREKSLALTKLEEAVMWAVKGITR